MCAQNRECLFGEIKNEKMELNTVGQIVKKWWLELSTKFPNIRIDEYVIMPNHLHGIVETNVGADLRVCPDEGERTRFTGQTHRFAPHQIIQWFKTMTTNEYIRGVKDGQLPPFHGKFWQRNYYEHVIRNEEELNKIREYIRDNPFKMASGQRECRKSC